MPSKSKKQARLMAAVAHNPKFAKKVGIPQSVGREFEKADTGHHFEDEDWTIDAFAPEQYTEDKDLRGASAEEKSNHVAELID